MIEIKKEILDKYQMDNIGHYINGFGEKEGTLAFCNAFLKLTDHIPLKIFEGSLTTADCVEELKCREYARIELAELNGEEYTPRMSKNIEERTMEAEIVSTAMLGTETNKDQASEQLRKALQMFAQTLTDDEAMEIATVYPAYAVGVLYKADTFVTYGVNGVGDMQLYKVVQEHTSQADWVPDSTPSLYKPIGLNNKGYPIWSRPTGAHDAYGIGDVVDYNGTLYKSLIDGNVYSPNEYPAGWEVYTETED